MRKIIASIDIGSNFIKLVVAEIFKNRIHILAASQTPSLGISKGFVVEPQSLISKLEEAFQKCENILGVKISKVFLGVPSENSEFFLADGSTTITNEDHVIRNADIVRAMQACTYNRIDNDREIVSIKPTSYFIDEGESVKTPIGMEASKLTVKCLVATIPRKNAYTLVKCLEQIGVQVIDFTLGTIGDYFEFQKEMMKDNVGVFINIGYAKTEISIFNKGLLTNCKTLDLGSKNIEQDLSYIFKVPLKDARDIKMTLSSAHNRGVSASIKKKYTTKTGEEVVVNEYEATEVASSRLAEILKIVKKEINHLTKKEIHYIMITGGVSEMTNFSLLLEEIFGRNAKVGVTKELGVRSNVYSTSVGLVKYYEDKLRNRNQDFSIFNEEEIKDLCTIDKKISFGENSILGKLFGYFFDN